MNSVHRIAVASVPLALAVSLAHAEMIVDTTFNNSDWIVHQSSYYNPGSTSASAQAVGQGFTGNAREVTNTIVGSGSGIYGINIPTAQVWDGSIPLDDLVMSIRARQEQSLQAFGFAVEQGGNYWIAGYFLTSPTYELQSLSLTAADFTTPFGVDPSSQPTNPDFAVGAAPIRFGFYVANSSGWSSGGYVTMGMYSDFTVGYLPSPGALAIAAIAGLLPGRRRSA